MCNKCSEGELFIVESSSHSFAQRWAAARERVRLFFLIQFRCTRTSRLSLNCNRCKRVRRWEIRRFILRAEIKKEQERFIDQNHWCSERCSLLHNLEHAICIGRRIFIDRSAWLKQWCENSMRVPESLLPVGKPHKEPSPSSRNQATLITAIALLGPFMLLPPAIVLSFFRGENSSLWWIIYSVFFVFCCAKAIWRIWRDWRVAHIKRVQASHDHKNFYELHKKVTNNEQ